MSRVHGGWLPLALVLGAGLALLTGCGGAKSYGGPSNWPVQAPSGDFTTAVPDPGSTRAAVTAPSTWELTRTEPGDPNVASPSWPDAGTALSDEQLKKAFPEAVSVGTPSCTKLTLPGNVRTVLDSRCTWSLTFAGTDTTANTVTLSLRGFGADAPMTAKWAADQQRQITGKLASDTFFAPGSFGAKGSYFLSSKHSSALLSDGKNAAWIDLDFAGFYQVFGDNSDKTVAGLGSKIFPLLVQDLSTRLPRIAEGVPIPVPGASSAPGTTP